MILAKTNSRIWTRSNHVAECTSMKLEQEQILSLKPGDMKFAGISDSPSPTASTVCSSGCTSETDESANDDNPELDNDAHESSEDEDNRKSCKRTCATEVQESHGTTVMMRNIPFEYTREDILELIDRQCFN